MESLINAMTQDLTTELGQVAKGLLELNDLISRVDGCSSPVAKLANYRTVFIAEWMEGRQLDEEARMSLITGFCSRNGNMCPLRESSCCC